jgi:hypothetical protein
VCCRYKELGAGGEVVSAVCQRHCRSIQPQPNPYLLTRPPLIFPRKSLFPPTPTTSHRCRQVIASGVRWLGEDYSFRFRGACAFCAGKLTMIHLQLPRARCRRRHSSVLLGHHRSRKGQESEADEDVQVRESSSQERQWLRWLMTMRRQPRSVDATDSPDTSVARFGVWGLRFGVWGLGFWVLGFGFWVWGFGFHTMSQCSCARGRGRHARLGGRGIRAAIR